VGITAVVSAVVADVSTQPTADGQIHAVAGPNLLHQGLAGRHLDPLQVGAQLRNGVVLQLAQQVGQVLAEQLILVWCRLVGKTGFFRVRLQRGQCNRATARAAILPAAVCTAFILWT